MAWRSSIISSLDRLIQNCIDGFLVMLAKSDSIVHYSVYFLLKQIIVSLGLLLLNPSITFWQLPESSIATTQSAQLPLTADVLIIGSGITSAVITQELLYHKPGLQITIYEARSLCSGATGCNS